MSIKKTGIILSVCIPTYNREKYLDICLGQFCKAVAAYPGKIELIVSDNCSSDGTAGVVEKYQAEGHPIQFIRNPENIGADRNITGCLSHCSGEYTWVFGDDDLLLDGKLPVIMSLLESGRIFSFLYLGNYWFGSEYFTGLPGDDKVSKPVIYDDKKAFFKRVNIWTTFLSAGIIHKSAFEKIDTREFAGSNLNHLQWVLNAVFSGGPCVYVEGYIIACKGDNTGGYSLFETFGTNLNNILSTMEKKGLLPEWVSKTFNYHIIKDFMPLYCIRYRQGRLKGFKNEPSPFPPLKKLYKKHLVYWLILFPVLTLPVFLAKKYYFGLKKIKLI
ncbi:MAG: glycosyltransferase [Chitinophagaceae bacterium]|nr:glycosyltransferase [Chitinophagaceae bacterium]